MPTGYTAPVEDGDITELKDFAANCARGFVAFAHQHDSTGRTLTYPPAPDDDCYAAQSLREAQSRLEAWLKADENERYRLWSEYVEQKNAYRAESAEQDAVLNARFDAMLAQVEAVDVPERLDQFKAFMIQQLTDSKYKDYSRYHETSDFYPWCDEQDEYLRRSLRQRRVSLEQERENYRQRVEYINLLRDTYGFEVETV